MKPFRSLSAVEQLAEYLRAEIRSGGLSKEMPGVAQLVRRLGVGTKTVVAALEMMKHEGEIEPHGERRRSRIVVQDPAKKTGLRIRILQYEKGDAHDEHIVKLSYELEQRGHHSSFAPKTLTEINFDVKKVASMVEKDDGDAWLVVSASRPVLEWFAERQVPAFALYGRQSDIPMARLATVKSPAMTEALHRLMTLGHRRIVMLTREERRKPTLGMLELKFLEELERQGIQTSAYNLPDWENNPQGFHRCLDALFRHTPPTALFPNEPAMFFATQQYLLSKGLMVPRDVSLIVLDDHPAFAWFKPEVSHVRTDTSHWVSRVLRWVDNIANGKEDRRATFIQAEFVEGGTIGPAPSI
jgi:DNA-binding LacI/PurR family transcriptional regulator/DNA-binding transcriptional regulator YhcF (GntR family)